MKKVMRHVRLLLMKAIVKYRIGKNVVFSGQTPDVFGLLPHFGGGGRVEFRGSGLMTSFRTKIFVTALDTGTVVFGDGVFINDGVNICASLSITCGKNVKLGDMTYIYDTDFHQVSPSNPVRSLPVTIGDIVWIGANCMVLAGSEIGEHSVIAAGSVVTGIIPPRSLAAGCPAVVIKDLTIPNGWVRA